jgi:hypothetical protein
LKLCVDVYGFFPPAKFATVCQFCQNLEMLAGLLGRLWGEIVVVVVDTIFTRKTITSVKKSFQSSDLNRRVFEEKNGFAKFSTVGLQFARS